MILYVNGDSHSAGAETVSGYCFAEDDPRYRHLGRRPHPENLAVSYSQKLADNLDYDLICEAESAGSNDRIIRTTKEYLKDNTPDLIVIGWATWEREEFLIDGVYYQFSGGIKGLHWPIHIKNFYQDWVTNAQPFKRAEFWHEQIHKFHLELLDKNINHLFFNSYTAFNHDFIKPINWLDNYIDPYREQGTYYNWLKFQGFETVNPTSYHFGADAHQAWANQLTKIINESIITK